MVLQRFVRASVAVVVYLLAAAAHAAGPPNDSIAQIRVSTDGAGPSHLFWVGALSSGAGDRIGIVDPLFSVIRLFDVERLSETTVGLVERLRAVGACSLPVQFRPWRIHQMADDIVIESMPLPGRAMQNATAATLRTTRYRMARQTLLSDGGGAFVIAAQALVGPQWDPARAPACGQLDATRLALGAGMPERAARGAKNPRRTIIISNRSGALSPTAAITIRSPDGQAYRLISARELEPTATSRIVQTTEGVEADDGLFRVTQRLIAYSRATRQPTSTMTFNDRFVRSKIGLRPVMTLPSGEVLAMGKYIREDASAFRLISCGLIGAGSGTRRPDLCVDDDSSVEALATPDLRDVEQPPQPDQRFVEGPELAGGRLTARRIFANVEPLVNFRFVADTTDMPEECRSVGGCPTAQRNREGKVLNFVPIRGVRLTRGRFERDGVPYAQAGLPGDLEAILSSTPESNSRALANAMQVQAALPGNLTDHLDGDIGVDCSGLVQVAFGARSRRPREVDGRIVDERLSTEAIQNFSDDLLCTSRLPNDGYLRAGDAINLNVKKTTNHVMLYAATIRVDTASEAWLMLESASGCDGVCWSFYDPSFFNGWGLYRAAGRSDVPCPNRSTKRSNSIPNDFDAWSRAVGERPPPAPRSRS